MYVLRIIPARAGFTVTESRTGGVSGDHPRSRGVYASPSVHVFVGWGSSPLARGLPLPHFLQRMMARIIPARAGFTATHWSSPSQFTDHPRSRGVYPSATSRRMRSGGSSPLARGLPDHDVPTVDGRRIIPARAGFTRCVGLRSHEHRDHPRSRGVYFDFRAVGFSAAGSSPLARGLREGVVPHF
mgnify:CR=1 FL=1